MLSRCAETGPCFGVVLTRSGSEVGDRPEIHEIGTSGIIVEKVSLPDGRSNLVVKGARRFQILEHDWDESYMVATVRWLDTPDTESPKADLNDAVRFLQSLLQRYVEAYNQATGMQATLRDFEDEPVSFAYTVASTLPMPIEARQRLLATRTPQELLATLAATVRQETALLVKTGAYASLPGHPGARFTSN
jgi:Lon protease-like protein